MRQKKVKEVLLIGIMIVICMVAAGCWDARELQERGFVLAVGIDTANSGDLSSKSAEMRKAETFVQHKGNKKYRMSLQILKLSAGGGGGESGGQKNESKTFILSNTGQSLFEMDRDMLGQSSKGLFFEHIQTIVISEAAVKEAGISVITDFLRRDPEMRWRNKVLITPGEAREILEYKSPTGEPSGQFLSNIVGLHKRNLHLPGARTELGFVTQYLDNKLDFILPRVVKAGEVVKVGGAAVFKKDKFAGYIDEKAVVGAKFIQGTAESGIITVECKEHPGQLLAFELFNHDIRVRPHADGDNVYFVMDMMMRGNLGEVTCSGEHDTYDVKYLQDAEEAFADEIKRLVLYSHQTSQDMGVDFNRLGSKLKASDRKAWERVKDRWDDIFPTVPLIVSVNVSIRNTGEHK